MRKENGIIKRRLSRKQNPNIFWRGNFRCYNIQGYLYGEITLKKNFERGCPETPKSRGIRIKMQSRRRVWLLFTAVIIAVFAMVGCIPEITPDKTPPDVTAKSATLSATTIEQGDTLTVTVEVTAEDKRSDLKNAQIKLMM